MAKAALAVGRSGPAPASFDVAKRAIRAGEWATGLAAFEAAVRTGAQPDASARLLRAIATLRSEPDPAAGIAALNAALVREADGRVDVRRFVVAPLVSAGALAEALAVLEILVAASPGFVDDHRLAASVLGRMGRWNEAIAHADRAAALEPANPALQGAGIRLRLQAGQVDQAARMARSTVDTVLRVPHDAHPWMMALLRDGDHATAARIAAALDPASVANARVAGTVVEALLADTRIGAAIAAGEAALRAGHDGATLRSHLGKAYLARGTHEDRTVSALNHFDEGLRLAPDDIRLLSLYGETLLRAGSHQASLEYLKKACELAPRLEQTRALYARALRAAGRHSEAADQWLELVNASPDSLRWQRSAVAALSQSGRVEEASTWYGRYMRKRSDALPDRFEDAFAQLDQKLDTASIAPARLDWAWPLRRDKGDVDRDRWERAARWGYLADHLLLEWLECREDRVEEPMTLLAELGDAERFVAPLLATGKGFIVATAHVGPMYAGLMMLELLGIPSRWVASTPGVARASYASALISTADQSEAQIAKACFGALQSGYAVCLAVDGALNPAAPRIAFEGQQITYSSFASRAAYRLRLPSIFFAPKWKDGRIGYTIEMLPAPEPDEGVDAYALRWQRAYLALLREYLAGPPENLRMSGGIWRHIRPVDTTSSP